MGPFLMAISILQIAVVLLAGPITIVTQQYLVIGIFVLAVGAFLTYVREQKAKERRKKRTVQQDDSDTLRKLKDMYQEGLITEDEYQEKKKDILSKM